jgi:hypothetical protein
LEEITFDFLLSLLCFSSFSQTAATVNRTFEELIIVLPRHQLLSSSRCSCDLLRSFELWL